MCALDARELGDLVQTQGDSLLALKRYCCKRLDASIYRQRFVCLGESVNDKSKLSEFIFPLELQVVILPFKIPNSNLAESLVQAAARGRGVEEFLEIPIHPDVLDGWAESALFVAASEGFADVVSQLLEAGACPDQEISMGRTPLWSASCCHGVARLRDSIRTVRLLLEAGADKDIADVIGLTPLFNAAMEGQLEVVRLLVKAGAQIDAWLKVSSLRFISL